MKKSVSIRILISTALILIVLISSQLGVAVFAASLGTTRVLETSVSIESTPNPSESNQAIRISGRLVSGKSGLSYKNVRIDSSVDGTIWIVLAWARTKRDGRFSLSWAPPQSASLCIRAYFPGDKQYSSSFSNTILQEIVPSFNFNVAISSSSISIQKGQQGSVSCSIVLLSGNTRTVRLSLSGLPRGCTYSFDPLSSTPPFSSTLMINVGVSQRTRPGSYTLTVKGASGRLTRTSSLSLIVTASVPSTYSLIVNTEPSGITTISGAGSYSAGSIADLGTAPETVQGGAGIQYVFEYWKVDGTQVSGNPPTITMDKNHAAVAVYKTQYYLKVQSTEGTPTQPSGYRDANTAITVSVPETVNSEYDTRYVCKSCLLDDASRSGNSACVMMDKPHNLTFVWTLQFYLILTCAITGQSLVGENWYDYGATATIQAVAAFNASDGKQYQFYQWVSTGAETPNLANPYASTTTLVMNSSGYQLEAQYDTITQGDPQLTISVSPAGGGSTTPLPGRYTYVSGSSVTVNETPATGYEFDHWDLDGSNMGSNSNYTVVMAASHTLTAMFRDVQSPPGQAEILVTVDSSKAIAVNNLSLGFMLECYEWKEYTLDSVRRELAGNARFGLVRVFDYKSRSPHPCTYWNESTRTGTFNWTDVDLIVQRIFEIGAEPLFCLGGYDSNGAQIPSGMAVNPDTNLPYPESFAAYVSEWVKHFKAVGYPVRFYEIVNEPWAYFGWEPVDFTKLRNYMQLFNEAAASMRQENSNLMISFDFIIRKPVLDYWLANGGADVDSLNFHKYGCSKANPKTDAELLAVAESEYFGKWPMGYTIDEARRLWLNARGKLLPVINSESNLNSAAPGTDPRIQQMVGAAWTALVLRMAVLNGLSYNVYYCFSSSLSWGRENTDTGGAGFGMVNSDNNQPWYPYYVHYMLGNSLSVGDPLVDITSSSEDVRTLAWIHKGTLNIFLICKVDERRTVYLKGVTGEAKFFKIDNANPWTTPSMQTGAVNVSERLTMNGYTVVLLQNSSVQTRVNPTLYEYHNTGDDGSRDIYGNQWQAQTFTAGPFAHTITSVRVRAFRVGSPGTLTFSIRAIDGSGHPIGNDLTSGTIDANTFTTASSGDWYEITVTEYTLSANTKYAIVCRGPPDYENRVCWCFSSTGYIGGNRDWSGDGGGTWTTYSELDFMFEVWGNALI